MRIDKRGLHRLEGGRCEEGVGEVYVSADVRRRVDGRRGGWVRKPGGEGSLQHTIGRRQMNTMIIVNRNTCTYGH